MSNKNKVGKMASRKKSNQRVHELGYYLIVTDTDKTEKNYMHGIRDSLPKDLKSRLVIRVIKAKTSELVQRCKEQREAEAQYREAWIMIDKDQVKDFDSIIEQAKNEKIKVAWSNPCIEIWFHAYFGQMPGFDDSVTCCRKFQEIFKKETKRNYRKKDPHIYETLNKYGNQDKAVRIAENRLNEHLKRKEDRPSQMSSCTRVFNLVDEIVQKCKSLTKASKKKT